MIKEKTQLQESMKILLLGDQAVGKSSLMMTYSGEGFKENMLGTAGVDMCKKNVDLETKTIKVVIFDTAGHERFRQITKSQYNGAHGIILVYDISDQATFESVSNWMTHINENSIKGSKVLLVGNKIDLQEKRLITTESGKELASRYEVEFIETSAKSGDNVDEAFMRIIVAINKEGIHTNNINLKNNENKKQKKSSKCCC